MILVTGGAGFIGSNLVAALDDHGHRVLVCDWLGSEGKWTNLSGTSVEGVVAPEDLDAFLQAHGAEVEFVYHMGAISSTTESRGDLIATTNISLPQRLWRWCAERRVGLVYASSAATYGDGAAGFDDREGESDLRALRPLNAYGWSKHVFDQWAVRQAATESGRPPQWAGLKFFNVYGPNEDHKGDMRSVVNKSFPAAAAGDSVTLFRSHHPDYEDGGQMRDFVYVKDCVRVMLWLREHPEVGGLFNLGTGRAQSWLDLMAALYDAVGQPMSVRWVDTPEDIRDKYQYFTEARMEKLRRAGYTEPFASVEEGVADYVKNYLSSSHPRR